MRLSWAKAAMGLAAIAARMWAQQAEAPRAVEIHVDQRCRIVEQADDDASQLNFRDDPEVCHLASRHDTRLWQGDPGAQVLYSIHEQDYVLTDTTDGPVTFVVAQFLPDGWTVDSDPQPAAIEGATAIFRVDAAPGQTVRLHVGVRKQLSPDPDSGSMMSPADGTRPSAGGAPAPQPWPQPGPGRPMEAPQPMPAPRVPPPGSSHDPL